MKLLLLICLLLTNLLSAQTYGLDWAIVAQDTIANGGFINVHEQESDGQGNIYVAGMFQYTTDMDPSSGHALLVSNSDQMNFFLTKYDSQGNFLWGIDFGGSGGEELTGMDVDSSGNVYLIGHNRYPLYYNPEVHDEHLYSYNGFWNVSGFLIKFNSDGEFEWVQKMDTDISLIPDDVEVSSNNHVFVSGRFKDNAFFSDSLSTDTLVSNGLEDGFIAKFTSNGIYEWGFSIGGNGDDNGLRLATDNAENVYVLAELEDTVDIDPSTNTYEVNNVTSFSSATGANTIIKYDSSGNFIWGHLFQDISTGSLGMRDIDVNSLGQLGVTGLYFDDSGQLDFEPGPGTANLPANNSYKGFVVVYDSSSTFLWGESIGGANYGAEELVFSNTDEIYSVGSVNDVFNGQPDAFLSKCGANGGVLFTKLIDATDEILNMNVSLNQLSEPVVSAQFSDVVDLDPSINTYNISPILNNNQSLLAFYTTEGDFQFGYSLNDNEYYSAGPGLLDDYANYIETDNNGNIFARGVVEGPVDFDSSSGSAIMGDSYNGIVFISKYDSVANYQWGFTLESVTRDGRITTDLQGNCYISATSFGTTDLDPSGGTALYTSQQNKGLVAKYNPQGSLIWSFGLDTLSSGAKSSVHDILIDSVGNVLIAGSYIGSIDFDPSAAQFVQSTNGMQDQKTFIAKYDTDGNFIWAMSIGRLHSDAVDLAVNSNNDIFITGSFYGPSIDIDPSVGTYNVSGTGNRLILLAKYDSAGNLQWGFALGDSDTNWGTTVAASNNSVYLSGAFSSTCDMDPGSGVTNLNSTYNTSTFLARFNATNGNLDWAFDLTEAWSEPRGMDINSNENIVISGVFKNLWSPALEEPKLMDVNPSADTTGLLANLYPNELSFGVYTCVYDSLSELQWAFDMPVSTRYYNYEQRGGIASYDKEGNILISGSLQHDADFAPQEAQYVLEATNGSDFYLAKYKACTSTFSSQNITACGNYNWNGNNYNSSGIYFDTISNQVGCDSVMSITLNILPIDSTQESITECNSYTWENGNTYTSSGTYYNYLINSSGCDSVEVLNLTIQNVDTTITELDDTTLFANQNGANYQWVNCDNLQPISGAQSQSYTPETPGVYAAIINLAFCTDTTACIEIDLTGLNQEQKLSQVKIYPNPTISQLNIDLGENLSLVDLQLLDATGRMLLSRKYKNTSLIELNIDYAPGTYSLILDYEGEIIQRRVVIGKQ